MCNETRHIRQITIQDKIEILIICYENRMLLLNAPATGVCSDEAFWRAVLCTVKAQLVEGLAQKWSTWSALKESVNKDTCRQSRRAKARAATPRNSESAECRQLVSWIEEWNKVWALREVLVRGAQLHNAVERLLGASELEDLVGDRLQAEVGSGPSLSCFSICQPRILDAIRKSRDEMVEVLPQCRRAYTEDLGDTPKQLHSPEASSSRAPEGSVILGTSHPPRSTGSPDSTDSDELPDIETLIRRRGNLSSPPRQAASRLKPTSETASDGHGSTGKAKDKGKGIDRGDKFNHDHCSHKPNSTAASGLETSIAVKPPQPAVKWKMLAKTEKRPAPILDSREDDGAGDARAGAAHTTRRKPSRTPALITEDNARVARLRAKPLKPVRVPHRLIPSVASSPARGGPTYPEITPRTFYQAPQDRSTETPDVQAGAGHGSGLTGCPLADVIRSPQKQKLKTYDYFDPPSPAPKKEFNYYDSPTSAGGSPESRMADHARTEPTVSKSHPRATDMEDPFGSSPAAPLAWHNSSPDAARPQLDSAPEPSQSKKSRCKKRKRGHDEQTPTPGPSATGNIPNPDAVNESPSSSATRPHKHHKHNEDSVPGSPAPQKAVQSPWGSALTPSPAPSRGWRPVWNSSPNHRGQSGSKGARQFHNGRRTSYTMPRQSGRAAQGGAHRNQGGPHAHRTPPFGPRADSIANRGRQHSQPVHKRFGSPSTPVPAPAPGGTQSPASSGLFVRSGTRPGGGGGSGFHGPGDSPDSARRRARESTVATEAFRGFTTDGRVRAIRSGFDQLQHVYEQSQRHLSKLQTQLEIMENQ